MPAKVKQYADFRTLVAVTCPPKGACAVELRTSSFAGQSFHWSLYRFLVRTQLAPRRLLNKTIDQRRDRQHHDQPYADADKSLVTHRLGLHVVEERPDEHGVQQVEAIAGIAEQYEHPIVQPCRPTRLQRDAAHYRGKGRPRQ